MVSEGSRPWGRGRSEFAKVLELSLLCMWPPEIGTHGTTDLDARNTGLEEGTDSKKC